MRSLPTAVELATCGKLESARELVFVLEKASPTRDVGRENSQRPGDGGEELRRAAAHKRGDLQRRPSRDTVNDLSCRGDDDAEDCAKRDRNRERENVGPNDDFAVLAVACRHK